MTEPAPLEGPLRARISASVAADRHSGRRQRVLLGHPVESIARRWQLWQLVASCGLPPNPLLPKFATSTVRAGNFGGFSEHLGPESKGWAQTMCQSRGGMPVGGTAAVGSASLSHMCPQVRLVLEVGGLARVWLRPAARERMTFARSEDFARASRARMPPNAWGVDVAANRIVSVGALPSALPFHA